MTKREEQTKSQGEEGVALVFYPGRDGACKQLKINVSVPHKPTSLRKLKISGVAHSYGQFLIRAL